MSEETNLRTPGEADAEAGSDDALTQAALDYHRLPTPGKIAVLPTKDMTTQRDLALAYSPGVAAACMAIKHAPIEAFNLTSRANLVAVISNGTAVLGLGNIGALAGKPVMEGKGCLFKKFAGIDVFDIEIDETDPDKLVEIIASLEPTFGGINLEDIKAPECFIIETRLRERMKIPVFHDDQHGTAIVAAAAVLNGLKVIGKRIEDVKLVCSGAGAAAIACLNLLVGLGVRKENILVTDSRGVLSHERLGALDVGAMSINEEMKLAAVRAIAELAQAEQSDVVSAAYGTQDLRFGPDFLIPRPFDPRLILTVAPAVAQAAIDSGVATRPFTDIESYRRSLQRFVYTSGTVMQPVFAAAVEAGSKRIAYAEGEDDRVLRAAQVVVDERLATPILVGRPDVIAQKIKSLGLRLQLGRDVQVASFDDETLLREATDAYYQMSKRQGLLRDFAAAEMRRNGTLIGAMLVKNGQADGMLCGTFGAYATHLRYIGDVIGLREGAQSFAAMNLLQLPRHTLFICDTYIHLDPTAEEIAKMTVLAAAELRRFGQTPRAALLSHSSFGTADDPSARKMRAALDLIADRAPDLEVEGEMHADAPLSRPILDRIFPDAGLTAEANLLIMPKLDAANITFNALKVVAGQGISVGPILLGAARSVHILTPTTTVRGIVNMTALTAVDATSHG